MKPESRFQIQHQSKLDGFLLHCYVGVHDKQQHQQQKQQQQEQEQQQQREQHHQQRHHHSMVTTWAPGGHRVNHHIHKTWQLILSDVQPRDAGAYMCQLNTEPMISQTAYLSVTSKCVDDSYFSLQVRATVAISE